MKERLKLKLMMGLIMLWGIITGRALPQWEDIANSPIWFGEIIMYWVLIIIGLIVIWQSHHIVKTKEGILPIMS